MAEDFSHHFHWNELQWHQEIRRDERRISCYLHELVNCLDLPEENSLIYGQLAASTDLVPTTEAAAALHNWFFRENDEDDCDDQEDEHSSPPAQIVMNMELLCTRWNQLCATAIPCELNLEALAISCAFAKLFARISDFAAPDSPAPEPLLITLGKHALQDLNHLTALLKAFCRSHSSLHNHLPFFLNRLGEIRESILPRLLSFHEKRK